MDIPVEDIRAAVKALRGSDIIPKDGTPFIADILEDGEWYRYQCIWPGPFKRTLLVIE